jgi:hypothetical protein
LDQQPETLDADGWTRRVAAVQQAGYKIVQSEWHHSRFDPPRDGPARSIVSMAIYVVHSELDQRIVVAGDLEVVWRDERDADGIPLPDSIDATQLKLFARSGPPGFAEILTVDHARPDA